jgi:hypothetical protein
MVRGCRSWLVSLPAPQHVDGGYRPCFPSEGSLFLQGADQGPARAVHGRGRPPGLRWWMPGLTAVARTDATYSGIRA